MKIVLTGAPHSGKSTLIKELEKRGYNVIHEAAIMVIDAIQNLVPDGALEWRRSYFESFQWLISQKQWELENGIDQKLPVTFLDRGALDGYGFAMHHKKEFPQSVKQLADKSNYDMVFILDMVLPFNPRSDTGRIETIEDCMELQLLLELAYYRHGYSPITVPLMSVEERADFVLSKITEAANG